MARILLVDDEPDIRYITRRMLERAGHSVVEAGDGETALDILRREPPDLVLLDVRMPGMNGWEVCRRIKEDSTTGSIPVVMFTVRTSKDSVKRSRECGAEAHINKPFEREELLELLERILEGAGE
ncbi:MAG: response regulator [Euryarchaeota archaeon]|nr:response regulator [Euryarchaeota archaeon]